MSCSSTRTLPAADVEKFKGESTTWGDGVFAVYRDLDASGALVAVRIELAG